MLILKMNYPECINTPEKLDYWLNFCSDIEYLKFFFLSILIPQSKQLGPIGLLKLLQNITFFLKGRYPNKVQEFDSYKQICEQAILAFYVSSIKKKESKKL